MGRTLSRLCPKAKGESRNTLRLEHDPGVGLIFHVRGQQPWVGVTERAWRERTKEAIKNIVLTRD